MLTFFNSFSLHSFSHTKDTSEFPGSSTELAVIFPRFLSNAVRGISCNKAFQIDLIGQFYQNLKKETIQILYKFFRTKKEEISTHFMKPALL